MDQIDNFRRTLKFATAEKTPVENFSTEQRENGRTTSREALKLSTAKTKNQKKKTALMAAISATVKHNFFLNKRLTECHLCNIFKSQSALDNRVRWGGLSS